MVRKSGNAALKLGSLYKERTVEGMEEMTDKELLQINVEEFSRLQGWMTMTEKETPLYKSMKVRYIELKVILAAYGISLTELDIIKE